MGLLDNILGGQTQGQGGGPSKMTLALMALLAYRTYQGKGRLAEMMGRDGPQAREVPPGGSVGRPQASGADWATSSAGCSAVGEAIPDRRAADWATSCAAAGLAARLAREAALAECWVEPPGADCSAPA